MKEKCCCKCDKCYTVLRIFALLALASVATYAVIQWWSEIAEAFALLKEKVLSLKDQIEIKVEEMSEEEQKEVFGEGNGPKIKVEIEKTEEN